MNTEVCTYNLNKKCKFGDKCSFAHSIETLCYRKCKFGNCKNRKCLDRHHDETEKKYWRRRCDAVVSAGEAEAAHHANQYVQSFAAAEGDVSRLEKKGFQFEHADGEQYMMFCVPPEKMDEFLANLKDEFEIVEESAEDVLVQEFSELIL